ncbi:MAG: glycerol-3-phosphate acyltransferase [Candidatus Promineifilaceae bacterium]
MTFVLSGLIGYLFGSLPAGYLLVKAVKKVDLRLIGSGRTGGTNSFRAAGVWVGILTSVLDVLKAACAVWVSRALFFDRAGAAVLPWLEATAGMLTIVGHNWSLFLGFKGGAGTGPNVGWAGAVWLPIVPISILVVLSLLLFQGMASVASLAMAAVIPLSFLALKLAGVAPYDQTWAYVVAGVATAGLVAWALRPNIKRLLEGRERIVGPRARRLERRRAEM